MGGNALGKPAKGGGVLNFCGMASYKLKFGTQYAYVPRFVFTKYTWQGKAKAFAKKTYFFLHHFAAKIRLKVKGKSNNKTQG